MGRVAIGGPADDSVDVLSPRHRPPVALRALGALLGGGVVLFNAALMLSDRVPGVTRRLGSDLVTRLSDRLDAGSRPARLAADPRLPSGDAIVHIGVWATAMLLVGLALWSWRGLVVGAAATFVASAAIEVGQGRYTDGRTPQFSDLAANGVGVAAGTVTSAGCYLLWSLGAQQFGGSASRGRTSTRRSTVVERR